MTFSYHHTKLPAPDKLWHAPTRPHGRLPADWQTNYSNDVYGNVVDKSTFQTFSKLRWIYQTMLIKLVNIHSFCNNQRFLPKDHIKYISSSCSHILKNVKSQSKTKTIIYTCNRFHILLTFNFGESPTKPAVDLFGCAFPRLANRPRDFLGKNVWSALKYSAKVINYFSWIYRI